MRMMVKTARVKMTNENDGKLLRPLEVQLQRADRTPHLILCAMEEKVSIEAKKIGASKKSTVWVFDRKDGSGTSPSRAVQISCPSSTDRGWRALQCPADAAVRR